MTDPAGPDLKSLWQAQDQETDPMTLEQIHALVGSYDRKTRRSAMVAPLATAFSALILGMSWMRAPETDVRIALALCFIGLVVCCMLALRLLLPHRDPAESAGAFLKRRLQFQIRKARGGWLWLLTPLVPGLVACFVVAFKASSKVAWAPVPLLVVVVAGLAFVTLRTRYQARKLEADLNELDRLMGS